MSSPTDQFTKRVRVEALLQSLMDAPEELDCDALMAQHPDLMPELGEQLQTLRAIYAARQAAHSRAAHAAPDEAMLAEEMAFFRAELPDYQVLAPLHRGGQGIVYKAVQKATERLVALKVPLGGALLSETQIERFEREVKLIAELNHPNIVTLYEAGVARGHRYFSMAFVEGVPIDDYVLANTLSVPDIVRLFVKVVRAVHHAHTMGIVHRDLKPGNILVDFEGEPHILDFGLAKALQAEEWDTAYVSLPGAILGTLPYLSPEQASGSVRLDLRSDVYTLAVVLYQLLTDVFPYPIQGDPETVRRAILETPSLSAREAIILGGVDASSRHIGHDLDAILQKALRKEVIYRYSSAAALADDLERHLHGELVEARVDAKHYLLITTLRKYRVAALVAGVLVLALAGALVGVTWAWRYAERVAAIAQAGLKMAGHVRLGGVVRDEGRLEQAATLFKQAAQIGESLNTSDETVQTFLYDAYHRLAQMQRKAGNDAQADQYAEKAVQQAEAQLRQEPGNAAWQRMTAFANLLRGEMAVSKKNWMGGRAAYAAAAQAFQMLIQQEPANANALAALAQAQMQLGVCQSELGQPAEALRNFQAGHALLLRRAELAPEQLQPRIDCVLAENNLAAWFLRAENADAERAAALWLTRAEDHLRELERLPDVGTQRYEIDRLRAIMRENQRLLAQQRQGPS